MNPVYLTPDQLLEQDFQTVHQAYENHMLLKNYSMATVKTYLCNFRKYNEWCVENNIEMIYHQSHVKAYLVPLRKEAKSRFFDPKNLESSLSLDTKFRF